MVAEREQAPRRGGRYVAIQEAELSAPSWNAQADERNLARNPEAQAGDRRRGAAAVLVKEQ